MISLLKYIKIHLISSIQIKMNLKDQAQMFNGIKTVKRILTN